MKTDVLPELRLWVRDETHLYQETDQGKELLARAGGKIEAVFIFDAALHVHCCELTPSFEMNYLYSVTKASPDDDEAREALYSDLDEANLETERVQYFHVRGIDLDKCQILNAVTAEEWNKLVEEHDGDRDAAYEEWREKQIEYYNCNHAY